MAVAEELVCVVGVRLPDEDFSGVEHVAVVVAVREADLVATGEDEERPEVALEVALGAVVVQADGVDVEAAEGDLEVHNVHVNLLIYREHILRSMDPATWCSYRSRT